MSLASGSEASFFDSTERTRQYALDSGPPSLSIAVAIPMNPEQGTHTRAPRCDMHRDTPLCILVVEDDPSVANMLEAVFRTWGYDVWVARNGQEGLEVVSTQSVDVIFLDMHMPIMNGRTMLDELRWMGYQLPVWVMSGGTDKQALQQFLQEGAQGFIIKPFQLKSLQQTCAQIFLSNDS